MLFITTIGVVNIYAVLCALTALQQTFDKLYTIAASENPDFDAFKAIFEPIMTQEDQEEIAQKFLLAGKQNANALKFFVDYCYSSRPDTHLNGVYADDVLKQLFPRFQEEYKSQNPAGIPWIHAIVKHKEKTLLRLWIDAINMDVDTKDSGDQTALCLAIDMKMYDYADLLMSAGADVNACDAAGKSGLLVHAILVNSINIDKLLQTVGLIGACDSIVFAFNTRNDHAIRRVLKAIRDSLVKQKRLQLGITGASSVEMRNTFREWSMRLNDFITIWKDLLKKIFVTRSDRFGEEYSSVSVIIPVIGGNSYPAVVRTIGELYCLVFGEDSSSASGDQIVMMKKIALLGCGIARRDGLGRIKVIRRPDRSVSFEVRPTERSRKSMTSVASDSDTSTALCSGGTHANVEPLCQSFGTMQIGGARPQSALDESVNPRRAGNDNRIGRPMPRRLPSRASRQRSIRREEAMDYSHRRSRSPVARQPMHTQSIIGQRGSTPGSSREREHQGQGGRTAAEEVSAHQIVDQHMSSLREADPSVDDPGGTS